MIPAPVVIVGAGPAGLAAAGALKQKGVSSTILEAGDSVGTSWRSHYERLHPHTERDLSNLPGRPIPAEMGKWVARADLVAYLEDYARHFQLEVRFGTRVEKVTRKRDGTWCVHTGEGAREELLHSSRYRSADPYRGPRRPQARRRAAGQWRRHQPQRARFALHRLRGLAGRAAAADPDRRRRDLRGGGGGSEGGRMNHPAMAYRVAADHHIW